MNLLVLKTEILNLLTATPNLTAAEKTKLRNRMVSEYQAEWDARVRAGTVDNATNRGQFVVDKTVDFWADIYKAGSERENRATIPAAEVMA